MKRLLKWTAIALAAPIVIVLLLVLALYLPPVQDFAVRQAAAYASEATGLDIRLERLRLSFLLDLDLQGLLVRDAEGDTLVAARSAVVDLDMTGLLSGMVGVDGIALNDVCLDTKELITTVRVAGNFGEFALHDDINLAQGRVSIADVALRDAFADITVRDTVPPPDTTETELPWRLDIERAEISRSHLRLNIESDTLRLDADINSLVAEGGDIDLQRQLYNVRACAGDFTYALAEAQTSSTLSLTITGDSVSFDGEAMHVDVGKLVLRTPDSRLTGTVAMDIDAFTPGASGQLSTHLTADVGRADVALLFALADSAGLASVATAWPDVPLHLALRADGNVDRLNIEQLDARLPGSLDMETRATLTCALDSAARAADMAFNVRSGDLAWLLRAFAADTRSLRLPPMQLEGQATTRGTAVETMARLYGAGGTATLRASLDVQPKAPLTYSAETDLRNINIRHFLPQDSIGLLTAHLSVKGRGTDIYALSTRLDAKATVSQLTYGSYDLNGLELTAHVRDGQGTATLIADNSLVTLRADAAALIRKPLSGITFGLDVSAADLKALGLTDEPLSVAACFHIDGTTDLSNNHSIDGTIGDIAILTADTLMRSPDIELQALLRPDTVHAFVSSGDLMIYVDTDNGYERLLKQMQHFTDELSRQWKERKFSLAALRQQFPMAQARICAGQHNLLYDILQTNDFGFDMANIDLRLSPVDGINGGGRIYKMMAGGVQLDTITFNIAQDTASIALDARVRNGRRNPQFRFDARLEAELADTGAMARLKYYDERGRLGVDLGLTAAIRDESLQLHLTPLDPIIAYRTFHLNPDNSLSLHKRNRIEADIDLIADDGTGLKFYSTPNDEALQDLSLSVNRLNLGELASVVPYAPKLTGFLHGDAHLIQQEKNLTISADITADDLVFEGAPMGQVGLQAVYLPNADGSHFIDGLLLQTGMPIATFGGTLGKADKNGTMTLDVDASLERFPLTLANGFIPNGIAQLAGQLMGDIHAGGTTKRPDIEGSIVTNDVRVMSDTYSLSMRLQDDTLTFTDSRLKLDTLYFYTQGRTPLIADGTVDFSNTDRIGVDVTMSAENYELMNAKKTRKALAYGKVYVDFRSQVRGTLDDLRMMARLKVLGNTDVTYVLTDSPLSADDQLEGLVEFVDFSDTLKVERQQATSHPQNMNFTMGIQIDEVAQLHCMLSPDGSNYVNLQGGGNLTMTYTPEKDLQLNGRYTVNHGTMKYTMMVIPLKEFTIKNGSYVEFRGPLLNPTLNISATESLTTTISEMEESRSVLFNVGLTLTQTLENMGLEFTIDAPEDMTVQSELSTMTKEQRSRAAVTMLATGMYVSESSSAKGLSGHNALNAFLQSQISNIAGKALKSVELSVGVSHGNSSTGTTTTDYSFRLAKGFWNNRINVIIGGRVSTGANASNTGQSILDNVTVEYRLDKSATRYVSAFYDKNHESIIDGDVTEMGAGLMLRRKTTKLGELFLFKTKKREK